MPVNRLYHGDNLTVLRRQIPAESVDLIYLDPPFNTNRNRGFASNKLRHSASESYQDTWRWNGEAGALYDELRAAGGQPAAAIEAFRVLLGAGAVLAYLLMMSARLIALREALRPTGSLYLHCDSTSSAYLRLLLDAVFGAKNFRNEIIWYYKTGGTGKRHFGRKHDTIYFYSRGAAYRFNPQQEKSRLRHRYGFSNVRLYADEEGPYSLVGMRDVWDIPALRGNRPEALGYPAQKPEALLERIIRAGSNEGDLVLDPFCGSGTTLAVAQRLRRRWIGIDNHPLAIELTQQRLQGAAFEVVTCG